MEKGKVEWISIRPKTKEISILNEVEVSVENGLIGDRYKKINGKRQVTLIQKEHLDIIASFIGQEKIEPQQTRRNIVVSGINLKSFIGKKMNIGNVILEITDHCVPCDNMDKTLGEGGRNAMEGMGGITARVIQGGRIKIGDAVLRD